MSYTTLRPLTLLIAAGAATLLLAGCGKSPAPEAASPAAETAQANADAAAKAEELAAKEKELAEREAALKQQEEAQAAAEKEAADKAAAEKAAAEAAKAKQASKAASTSSKTPTKAATAAAASTPKQAPPPPPKPISVPAGTQLAVEIVPALTTKTNKVGDAVQGRLKADLVVGGRRAVAAGAPLTGSITKVVSGSDKIGATPKLVIVFNDLAVGGGKTVPINAKYVQEGQSEKGRDTAKIVGGAAAGAIIGNQVIKNKGSVVGGVIGGAAGAIAAHETGTEATIAAGSVVTVATGAAFEVTPE